MNDTGMIQYTERENYPLKMTHSTKWDTEGAISNKPTKEKCENLMSHW